MTRLGVLAFTGCTAVLVALWALVTGSDPWMGATIGLLLGYPMWDSMRLRCICGCDR